MYNITQSNEEKYTIYHLIDSSTNSWMKVAPERGGIIIGFGVEGEEILFLNKETFIDSTANVRGGIPILFPMFGQLEQGKYEWNGKIFNMKNHGFARNLPWEVLETNSKEHASITLSLRSNEETLESFPFEFEVIFTYKLKGNKLTIEQVYKNESDEDMPIYPGFHPYFKSVEKNLNYETDANTYLDYNDMERKQVKDGLDLTHKKESFVLLDSKNNQIAFDQSEINKKIKITYGEEFKYVYLWTEQNQDFVCVEPAMGMTNEFNRKEGLVFIKPKNSLKTEMAITVE